MAGGEARTIEGEGVVAQRLEARAPIGKLGRYEVLGRLGAGRLTERFVGREVTAVGGQRHVMMQVLLPRLLVEPGLVRLILEDCGLALQVSHPGLAHLFEVTEIEGHTLLVTEWIEGLSLDALLARAAPLGGLPAEVGVQLVAQIADALHTAHRATDGLGRPMGLVHGGLGTHEVRVGFDGQAKVLGLGVARGVSLSLALEGDEDATHHGAHAIRAPEQWRGEPAAGVAADVFALGACLYAVLTGEALYARGSAFERMQAVLDEETPSVRAARPELPEALDAVVARALAKAPEDRYASAGELVSALERWLAETRAQTGTDVVAYALEPFVGDLREQGPALEPVLPAPAAPVRGDYGSFRDDAPDEAPRSTRSEGAPRTRARPGRALLLVALTVLLLALGAGYWAMASGVLGWGALPLSARRFARGLDR